MSNSASESIYQSIASIRLIDPHTHINPHQPAANTLADLLGYHYYTELAHSAGLPKEEIEEEGLPPRELVHRLVSNLTPIENTVQYRWLVELSRMFFGFDGDRIDLSNWEQVYDSAEQQMQLADWPHMVLDQSNVEAVFLTNDFDDQLSGFDTDTYIPCLRTDDLVFHLAKPETRERLAACSGFELDGSLTCLRDALQQRFEHFVSNGARACAISLPPTFQPTPVSDGRAATALDEVLRSGPLADPSHQNALSRRVFWTLAELCDQYKLPFDLMIGVNRGVYEGGVFQGQDLYDSRVSLIQYRALFNSFPDVKFPISVLASVTNQELVSYAWIFPNVITNGHWWYSNTPSFIARDAAARLEAVPQTKQIAYYSDAYKLEFVWPKFDMYRRVLAGILADHFVKGCGWSEERAVELGRQVLRDNVDEIFPRPRRAESTADDSAEGVQPGQQAAVIPSSTEQDDWVNPAVAGSSAALAAGAIGMVEVRDSGEPDTDSTTTPTFRDDESYSTVIEPDSSVPRKQEEPDEQEEPVEHEDMTEAAPAQLESLSEEFVDELGTDSMLTVVEDADSGAETVHMEETEDEGQFSELTTVLDVEDTVRMEVADPNQTAEEPHAESEAQHPVELEHGVDPLPNDLDPLPSDDEIQAVGMNDVELSDFDAATAVPDADAIEAEADSEPIDVGDLLGDDEPQEGMAPEIHQLRGEKSFEPDEDSLQLKPDPATGELTFPVPSSQDEPVDVAIEPAAEADVLDDANPDADVLATANDNWLSDETSASEFDSGPQTELPDQDLDDVAIDEGNNVGIDEGDNALEEADSGFDPSPFDASPIDDAEADEELDLEPTLDFEEVKDPESPEDPDDSGELYL